MSPRRFFVGRTIGLLLILGIAGLAVVYYYVSPKSVMPTTTTSPKNATYIVEGKPVTLVNGVSEVEAASGSASKIITKYFGNEVTLDLDDDGRVDSVFLITQERGGSGIFFYVVAALNKENGFAGSDALFLGDRIAPQTTERGSGKIVVVNYADRKPGEDFTVVPSVAKSIWLLLDADTMQFGEVEQNFEGEADPSGMTLGMKEWIWISALYNDGREIAPKRPGSFTITFGTDGRFTTKTDCNNIAGNYSAKDAEISFSDIISTKMFCEGSQEIEFSQMLINSSGYHFTSRGELILDLKFDSGTVTFR